MKKKVDNIEEIERKIDSGEEVIDNFNSATLKAPIKLEVKKSVQRVNVDISESMLKELDYVSNQISVSRQAVIKTFLRQALDEFLEKEKLRKFS